VAVKVAGAPSRRADRGTAMSANLTQLRPIDCKLEKHLVKVFCVNLTFTISAIL
jgi:hypothetical protein